MQKNNIFLKKINKSLLSTTKKIESFFNFFKENLFNKKKGYSLLSTTKRIENFFNFFKENFFNKKKGYSLIFKTIDKRILLTLTAILITIISYFLLPALYDKNKIKVQLENQILDKYNLEVKLGQSLRYGLLPKPHFYFDNVTIIYKSNEIATSNNTKISISIKNFFFIDRLNIKDLIFKQTDFKIGFSNFKFFIDLLNNIKSNEKINFFNSKLFYLDRNDDVIFLTNINNLNYLYQENILQTLNSKFNIFNIPISLYVEHDAAQKIFFTKINSHPLRLKVENNSNYNDEKLDGQIDLTIINKNKKINYSLKNNSINFNTSDNEIIGDINMKPFFLSSDLKLSQIDLKKIFEDDSILINILKSEILNNKNLNGKIDINTKNFKGVNFLNEIKFNILFEQGDVFLQNLRTTFKDCVIINVSDTQLIVDNNMLTFAGYITLDFIDVNDFYAHYQINRSDRKDIKKVNFEFLFNLDENFIEIDNVKIDGNSNQNLEKFLRKLNSKKEDVFNKVVFRNSIKDFFRNF